MIKVAQTLLGINVTVVDVENGGEGQLGEPQKSNCQHAPVGGKIRANDESISVMNLATIMTRKLTGLSQRYRAALPKTPETWLTGKLQAAEEIGTEAMHLGLGDAGPSQDSRASVDYLVLPG